MNCHLCHEPTALTEKELARLGTKLACSDCAVKIAEQIELYVKVFKEWKNAGNKA